MDYRSESANYKTNYYEYLVERKSDASTIAKKAALILIAAVVSGFPFMTDRESARQCSLKDAVCVVYGATIPKLIPGRCSWNTLQTAARAVADVRLYARQAQERLPMESANGIRKAAFPALHAKKPA